jgi:hypothetical protein
MTLGTVIYFSSSILVFPLVFSLLPYAIRNTYLLVGFLAWIGPCLAAYYWLLYLRFSPLGFKTTEIANYKGDLSQLVLRARTSAISNNAAYRCLKNANPIVRYFGVLVLLAEGLETGSADTEPTSTDAPPSSAEPTRTNIVFRPNWSKLAAIQGWKPLYLAYLKMSFREGSLKDTQRLFDLLLEANADDPRIVYLLSTLPDEQRGKLSFRLDSLNTGSLPYAKVLAHAVFEQAIQRETNWWRIPASFEASAQFAMSLTGMEVTNRMQSLAKWFNEHGQFWHSGLAGPVTLELEEEDLQRLAEAFSPHRESGLASFRDLPISIFYLRLYRFFSEIQWRIDQGDVILKH